MKRSYRDIMIYHTIKCCPSWRWHCWEILVIVIDAKQVENVPSSDALGGLVKINRRGWSFKWRRVLLLRVY